MFLALNFFQMFHISKFYLYYLNLFLEFLAHQYFSGGASGGDRGNGRGRGGRGRGRGSQSLGGPNRRKDVRKR